MINVKGFIIMKLEKLQDRIEDGFISDEDIYNSIDDILDFIDREMK